MRPMRSIPITGQTFERILDYCPETGIFRRKMHGRAGKIAGQISTCGYRQISVRWEGKRLQLAAHRVAWMWMHGRWPKEEIDHINGDKRDNRIDNLRELTRGQNQTAGPQHHDSTQPYKGVFLLPSGRWRSWTMKDYKRIHIGVYDTAEEAHAAYVVARQQLHGV